MTDRAERRFEAMGTSCHVVVIASTRQPNATPGVEWAEAEVRRLQALWTRFETESELSRLNRHPHDGSGMAVSPETQTLARRALRGFRLTGGIFDPFLADELADSGYDRTFARLEHEPVSSPASDTGDQGAEPRPNAVGPDPRGAGPDATGPVRTERDAADAAAPVTVTADGRVILAPGASLDSGGIGKGLAADLIADELFRRGFAGALVNLGGDVRCVGHRDPTHPQERWQVGIDDPWDRPTGTSVRLDAGAVCTSTEVRRRWRNPDGTVAHHLIDPRTLRPARTSFASATVIAPAAWLGEVLAKAILIGTPWVDGLPDTDKPPSSHDGDPGAWVAGLLRDADAHALVTDWSGHTREL